MKKPLSPARAWWKATYRLQRIACREILAAAWDCVLFGTGAYEVGPDVPDFVRRIDPASFYFYADGTVTDDPLNRAPLT